MTPVKGLFQRMDTTVRSYAETAGKKISVVLSGNDTELDKSIIDTLAEPLIHLVRNAMDHGIEGPEARRLAAKPEIGTIHLGAEVRGNEVVVTVRDDGKGIDATKVLASARKKGLDVTTIKTEAKALDLIFMPGFSTAEQVNEVSGRGVGMDAVRTYVENIGGNITLTTEVGVGTTFSLCLPLGMSVIPVIIVNVNRQLYAISINDVLETRRVSAEEVLANGPSFYFEYKGELIECIFLENYLSGSENINHLIKRRSLALCIVRANGRNLAFCVTDLVSNTEIVAKPLPALAPRLPYITGVAVLVSGEPAFVLSLGKWYQRFINGKMNQGVNMGIINEAA